MGWITFRWNGSARDYFTELYAKENGVELIDISIVKYNEAYLALKCLTTGFVYCQAYLLHRAPKSDYNFGYKPLVEFCGPNISSCPKRILDKLSSIDEMVSADFIHKENGEWAKIFRNRCIEKTKNKFISGMTIKVEKPIKFSNGLSYEIFKKVGRKTYAVINHNTDNEFTVGVRVLIREKFEVIHFTKNRRLAS